MNAPACPRCDVPMQQGVAIQSTVVGSGDFHDDDEAATFHHGGPGRLINCWKCPACGHSLTILGPEDAQMLAGLLNDPPEPSESLLDAAREYARRVKRD